MHMATYEMERWQIVLQKMDDTQGIPCWEISRQQQTVVRPIWAGHFLKHKYNYQLSTDHKNIYNIDEKSNTLY